MSACVRVSTSCRGLYLLGHREKPAKSCSLVDFACIYGDVILVLLFRNGCVDLYNLYCIMCLVEKACWCSRIGRSALLSNSWIEHRFALATTFTFLLLWFWSAIHPRPLVSVNTDGFSIHAPCTSPKSDIDTLLQSSLNLTGMWLRRSRIAYLPRYCLPILQRAESWYVLHLALHGHSIPALDVGARYRGNSVNVKWKYPLCCFKAQIACE